MDRRKSPRFRVQFRGSFTIEQEHSIAGEGTVVDLSLGGCRVESGTKVPAGSYLELRIHVPGLDEAMSIAGALVIWFRDREFGVEFIRIPSLQEQRLRQVVKKLRPGDSDA
jgi:c-di-GMP-binding flagellar brake protein YcgR